MAMGAGAVIQTDLREGLVEQTVEHLEAAIDAEVMRRAERAAHEGDELTTAPCQREVGLGVAAVDRQHQVFAAAAAGRSGASVCTRRGVHPFTPVSVMPSTKTFWARKKMTITGSMTSRVAAMVRFHCTW